MIVAWVLILITTLFSLSTIHQEWENYKELRRIGFSFWEATDSKVSPGSIKFYFWNIEWPMNVLFAVDSQALIDVYVEMDEFYWDLYLGKFLLSLKVNK